MKSYHIRNPPVEKYGFLMEAIHKQKCERKLSLQIFGAQPEFFIEVCNTTRL